MKSRAPLLPVIFLFILFDRSFAQAVVSGVVRDSVSGEAVIGADVSIPGTRSGSSTDGYGLSGISGLSKDNSCNIGREPTREDGAVEVLIASMNCLLNRVPPAK